MTESALSANFVVGFSPSVVSAIQDRMLVRAFRDSAYPKNLYRGEAQPELWVGNVGTNMTFSRTGLMRPTTRPTSAPSEPTPTGYGIEQWEGNSKQYSGSIDTHMPTSHVAQANLYLRNMHQLGLHSAQSMNRVTRDKGFNAYLSGNTVVRVAVGAGTSVPVVSLNGFSHKLLNGRPTPVSAANPLAITLIIGGVPTSRNVTAATPDFAGDNIHSGTLTIDVAHAGLAARDIVLASNRAEMIYSGGSASIDGIGLGDVLTMADLRAAVAKLRRNNMPAHEDGAFHVHLDPDAEMEIFSDNEFQRLHQGTPDHAHYREFAIASLGGMNFYRNSESPLSATVDQDPSFGFSYAGEVFNVPLAGAPVEIHRTIITAGGWLEEKYHDESAYISEAGINGKMGEFAVVNNGIQVMAERVRVILRSPQDRLQQQTSTSWSWSGDMVVPTDELSLTSAASFKRGVIVSHA